MMFVVVLCILELLASLTIDNQGQATCCHMGQQCTVEHKTPALATKHNIWIITGV